MAAASAARQKTMASRKPAVKSKKKPVTKPEIIMAPPQPLPSVLRLFRQAIGSLGQNKKLFAGIIGWYVVLTIIFAQALTSSFDIVNLRDQFGNRVLGSAAVYTQLLSTTTTNSSQAAGVYQLLLFLFVSLALIWTLRQQRTPQAIRVRDAYYKGMYPLIPFILVILVIALQLLPLIIGASLYQQVVVSGIAASGLEVLAWGIGALILGLLSAYWLASSVFGLYIVTLPDMTPLRALRAARQLVRYRRWIVLRKLLFLPLALGLLSVVLLLPIIVLLPVIAQWSLLLFGAFAIALAHAYLYNMYLRLMNE